MKKCLVLLLCAVCISVFGSCSSVKNAGTGGAGAGIGGGVAGGIGDAEDSRFEEACAIRLSDGVDEEMLSASYWISRTKNPYEQKMTLEEIGRWNRMMMNRSYSTKSGIKYLVKDLRACDTFCSAREIRDEIGRYNPRSEWYEMRDGEITLLDEKDWLRFYRMTGYEKLGSEEYYLGGEETEEDAEYDADYPVRKGICVRRADLRLVPDETFYCDDRDFWYDNIAQNSGIQMNEPVLIKWESADKKWLFVETNFCNGWVRADAVAFCSDEEFDRYFDFERKDQSSFVTVTAERITIGEDCFVDGADLTRETVGAGQKSGGGRRGSVTETELFMGNYLFCADWSDERFKKTFSPRVPYGCYIVEIPFRKDDGSLGITWASVPASCCTKGLLEYTSANVLTLAFNALGIRYGWGGMEKMRDCSEYVKDIYHCFGFMFPRNSSGQIQVPGKEIQFAGKKKNRRRSLVESCDAGDVLGFPGHVMLYLGSKNGRQYVISAAGSYYPEDFDKEDEESQAKVIHACSVNINTLDEYRKNGKTWLENLSKAKRLVPAASGVLDFEREVTLDKKWKFAENAVIKDGKAILYKAKTKRKNLTVALNAGHGCRGGESQKTWSHPDKSPKLTGGTTAAEAVKSTAVSTGMTFTDGRTEAEVNLRVAHLLKNLLLSAGYDVLMIRDGYDVQLDNVARTVISNNCADIHVAIHFDNDGRKSDKGCFYCSIPEGLFRFKNVKKHAAESERLGECLIEALRDEGLEIYDEGKYEIDLTQTSYSTIPTVDIELGNRYTDTSTAAVAVRAEALFKGIENFFGKQGAWCRAL